jgi:ABC-type sugar transport system substrate-binding protein
MKRLGKIRKGTLLLVFVGLSVSAFVGASAVASNGSGKNAASVNAADPYTVGISYSELSIPYFKQIKNSVDAAAKKVPGLKLFQLSANNDASKQLDQISLLISQKPKLILLNSVDASLIVPGVMKIRAAKIPMMTFDRMIPSAQKFMVTHIGASAEEAGYVEAQAVCKMKKNARILAIWGVAGNQTTRDRVAGVKRGMTANGCHLKLVAEKYEGDETTEAAAATMGDWLQKYPAGSVDAVVNYGDGQAAGVLSQLHASHRTDIVVTGAANFDPFHHSVCSGDKQALADVDFNTAGQGRVIVATIQKYMKGAKLPAWVKTPELLVTGQNKVTCSQK